MREQLQGTVRGQLDCLLRVSKQPAALLLLFLAGCSTAPVADFMDFFFPPRFTPGPNPIGGVCAPKVVGPAPPGTAQPIVNPPAVFPAMPPGPATPSIPIPNPPPPPPPPPDFQGTPMLQRPADATPADNAPLALPKS
jgi:hypothetical protein